MNFLTTKLRAFADIHLTEDLAHVRDSVQSMERVGDFIKVWIATEIAYADETSQRTYALEGEWRSATAVAYAFPCYLLPSQDSLGTTLTVIALQPKAIEVLTALLLTLQPQLKAVPIDPFLQTRPSVATQSVELVNPSTGAETAFALDEPAPLGSILEQYGANLSAVSIVIDVERGVSLYANRLTQQAQISMPQPTLRPEAEVSDLQALLPLIDQVFADDPTAAGAVHATAQH